MNMVDIDALTYPEVEDLIQTLRKRMNELSQAYWAEQHHKSLKRSAERAEQLKIANAAAVKLFETVKEGDIVRVIGVRDTRYPYRCVTSKQSNGFTGWQMRKLRDGSFQQGCQHTDHMSNKIREVIKQ